MPEYNDKDIRNWMNTYHRVYDIVEPWREANLVARNKDINYMKGVLISARRVPNNLIDEHLRKKISILEEAIKIFEDKHKNI